MRGIEKELNEFQNAGVRPIAISVDPPDVSANFCKLANLTYTFLSDPKLETIRRYDLVHPGGHEGNDISRSAEFLVDSSGTVRWENFTEDIRVRPRADQMLAEARKIQ